VKPLFEKSIISFDLVFLLADLGFQTTRQTTQAKKTADTITPIGIDQQFEKNFIPRDRNHFKRSGFFFVWGKVGQKRRFPMFLRPENQAGTQKKATNFL